MRQHPAWLLFGLVLLAHLPALQGLDFHYDDGHSLVRNPHIRELANLPRFFLDPTMFSENPADAMYRPVVLVAHSLSEALSPGHPAGFLALNLALHALAALLLHQILGSILPGGRSLFAAAIFALHPLQTEVINYASARSETLAALGILMVVLAFLRHRDSANDVWIAVLIAGQLLALGSKETGVIAPLLLLAVHRAIPAGPQRISGRAILACTVVVVGYLIVYQSIREVSISPDLRPVGAQLATQTKALLYYFRGALLPVDLSITPQFSQSHSLLDWPVILAVTFLASAALLLWQCRHRVPILGLAFFWWLVCLSPTLLVPLNVLVNDHRPYLAMGGLAMAAGTVGMLGRPRQDGRVKGLLLAVLIVLCWQRAIDWKTEISLWEDAVREGPAMPVAHHNLAFAYHQTGKLPAAQHHYERAIDLQPDYTRPLTNLGAIYRESGELDKAESVLLRAMRSDPGAAEPLNNLGLVYAAQGRPEQALRAYQTALQAHPYIADIWFNLGLAQRDAGQGEAARQSLHRALELDPGIRQRTGHPDQ